jgi:hypothetical protein
MANCWQFQTLEFSQTWRNMEIEGPGGMVPGLIVSEKKNSTW